MLFGYPTIEIAAFSVALVIISRVLQIWFGNKKEVNSLQAQVKEKQARLKELLAKEDPKSKQESQSLQSEMMNDLNKMMSSNMRIMLISMIVFFPGLGILAALYNGITLQSPIPLLVFHRGGDFFFWVELSNQSNWFSWYFWWAIISGVVLAAIFKRMKIE